MVFLPSCTDLVPNAWQRATEVKQAELAARKETVETVVKCTLRGCLRVSKQEHRDRLLEAVAALVLQRALKGCATQASQ
jgi:hypothetical protein